VSCAASAPASVPALSTHTPRAPHAAAPPIAVGMEWPSRLMPMKVLAQPEWSSTVAKEHTSPARMPPWLMRNTPSAPLASAVSTA